MRAGQNYLERRKQQFRSAWPGLTAFWPGAPVGAILGLAVAALLIPVVATPVALASSTFALCLGFLVVQVAYDSLRGVAPWPEAIREAPVFTGVLVLLSSLLGAALVMTIAYTIAYTIRAAVRVLALGSGTPG